MQFLSKTFIFQTLLLTLFCSCGLLFPTGDKELKDPRFESQFRSPQWVMIPPDKSDMAFSHSQSGSIIMGNSLCKKYEATDLKILAQNLLSGISSLEIDKSETRPFHGREAVSMGATGRMDGIKVYLNLVTFRKNHCTYDMVLISSSKKDFDKDRVDFEKFLANLKVGQ